MYVLQHGKDSFSLQEAKDKCNYLMSVGSNGNFIVYYSYDQLPLKPYVALLVITEDESGTDLVSYKVPEKYYRVFLLVL